MSLLRTNSKQSTLTEIKARLGLLSPLDDRPYIVAIVGGSASGKTTVAYQLQDMLPRAMVISQDIFQLGDDFVERKISQYRWDDPRNFDLTQCAVALADLKMGKPIQVPNFEVVANLRTGTQRITPASYIIWEGIYALGSDDICKYVDMAIFMDTPFLIRLLRRISRFFQTRSLETIADFSTPARQMLTFVWAAEKDYGLPQRTKADYCITFKSETVSEEVEAFTQTMLQILPASLQRILPGNVLVDTVWHSLRFAVKTDSFDISRDNVCLYSTAIDQNLASTMAMTLRKVLTQ